MNCFSKLTKAKIFIARINIFSFFIKAEIDENSNPNNPASTLDDDNRPPPVMSKYDPNIDYERLMCEDIYEDLKGDPFIEEMMNGIRKNYGEL
ncbi:unnamed protein product [Rhizophagus irregularis]|nr:unnamed protein product [Rhizophagus irregularis]